MWCLDKLGWNLGLLLGCTSIRFKMSIPVLIFCVIMFAVVSASAADAR